MKYDLNFLNNSLDLTLSRDNVIFNEKWKKQIKTLRDHIIEELPKCLVKYIDYLKGDDIEKRVRKTFLEGIRNFDDKRIKNLIKRFFYFNVVSESGVKYAKYEELLQKKQKIKIIRFKSESYELEKDFIERVEYFKNNQGGMSSDEKKKLFRNLCKKINVNYENLVFTSDFGKIDEFYEGIEILEVSD